MLCKLADIPDQEAKEFELLGRKIVALRDKNIVLVYLNICPHLGTPLNWEPNKFLDEEGVYIRCSNHGALFVKTTGECISGPCKGMPLSAVPAIVKEGEVLVELEPLKPYQPF